MGLTMNIPIARGFHGTVYTGIQADTPTMSYIGRGRYRLGEMPIQSCGQSVSAPRVKAGAGLNVHTELRAKRQRSAREAIYRIRPIVSNMPPGLTAV